MTAEMVAWQTGIDLARAGRPVAAFLTLSVDKLRAVLPGDTVWARTRLGPDHWAMWVRQGVTDACEALR